MIIIENGTTNASRHTLKTEKGFGAITRNLYMPNAAPNAGMVEPRCGEYLKPTI